MYATNPFFDAAAPSIVIFLIISLVASIAAIKFLYDAALDKGYERLGLVFIGIFASPIVMGICVAALPDKETRRLLRKVSESEELPSV